METIRWKEERKNNLRNINEDSDLCKAQKRLEILLLWWKDHIRGKILELLTTGDIITSPIQGEAFKKRIQEGIAEGGRWVSVTDIYTTLRVELTTASCHLSALEDVGGVLISQRGGQWDGQFIYYRINEKKFTQISESLSICFPKKKNPEDKDDTWDPLEWEKNEISDDNKE